MSDELREQLQEAVAAAYTIQRELGGGGMSRVYLAVERAFDRTVVIKLLAPELAAGVSVDRFKREIQLAARLQHAHIVPVITAGESHGLPWYTMPFVEGESLRARLAAEKRLPIALAVSILRDVAKALAYAHGHGVVHRDIKPDNILIAGGAAAVADFGIAKALDAAKTQERSASLTQVGTSIGTPAYMAPEQSAGDPDTDHRADIYSFGCVAYEMFTGAEPFHGRPVHQLLMAHASEKPAPVESLRADTPPALARLVDRCLAKDPAARPQSAGEILEALDAVGTPGAAPIASTTHGSRRRIIGAIAAILIIAAAAMVFVRMRATPKAEDRQLIAIVPFRVAGADPSLRYLREGMLDLLATKLSSETGIRSIDSRTTLASWHKAGGSETTDLPDAAARDVAHNLGAGRLLVGEIVGAPSHVTLSARLIDANKGSSVNASVEGPVDSLGTLVDRLTAQLLALGSGEGADLAALTSTSLPALKSYLEGRVLDRQAKWDEAVAHYNAALTADSNFALAALRLIDMSGWTRVPGLIRASRIARRNEGRFGPADRQLLKVLVGSRAPAPRTGGDYLRQTEAYVALAPDAADAWYRLGEGYFHYGRAVGYPDANKRAARAIERSLQLDSTYAPALEHLLVIYTELGDSAGFRRARSLLERDTTHAVYPVHRLFAEYVTGDSARIGEARARLDKLDNTASYELFYFGVRGMASMSDVQRVIDAHAAAAVSPAERSLAEYYRGTLALDRGQPAKAARLLAGDTAFDVVNVLAAVLWDGDSVSASAAERRMIGLPLPVSSDTSVRMRIVALNRLTMLAVYHASRGDTAKAREDMRHMQSLKLSRDNVDFAGSVRRSLALPEAQLATIGKRPDLRQRLAVLDSGIAEAYGGLVQQLGPFISARGWEALGDSVKAREMIARKVVYINGVELALSTRLREEGRLAARIGDRDGAIKAYRLFLHMRNAPEPSLKADADRVRAELARLEKGR